MSGWQPEARLLKRHPATWGGYALGLRTEWCGHRHRTEGAAQQCALGLVAALDETEPLLFHGTRAGFRKGGYLFGADWHGKPRAGHVGEDSTRYAYATLDHDMAAFYAFNDRHGRGRPKVLTVVPLGPCEADPSVYDEERGHQVRCAAGFRVVAVEMLDPADFEFDGQGC